MAKMTTGSVYGITRQQFIVITELAKGHDIDYIAQITYNCRDENGDIDKNKLNKAKRTIRGWLQDKKVMEAYRNVIREDMIPEIAKACKKLAEQIEDPNGWLANKASNDILTRFSGEIFGDEDKSVRIVVEGMPELGTPSE